MLNRNMRHRVWPLLKALGGDVGLPGLFGLPDKGDLRPYASFVLLSNFLPEL